MREIKFRTWSKTYKEMLYVATLNFVADSAVCEDEKGIIHTQPSPFKKGVVMQSIGKIDTNDKLIYGGDIVQDSVDEPDIIPRIGCIVWDDNACGFMVEWTYNGKKTRDCIDDWDPTIIGNIYKNPELLKEVGK